MSLFTAILSPQSHRRKRRAIPVSSSADTDEQRQYPDADGRFSKAPYFNFNDDKLKFDTKDVDNANDNYGSVSGLLPKSLLNILSYRAQPAAEHSAYFINNFLQSNVLLGIKGGRIFHEPNEKAQHVQFCTCLLKNDDFVRVFAVPGLKDTLDHIKNDTVAALVDSMTIMFVYCFTVLVKELVKVICFFQYWNFIIIHRHENLHKYIS